jgi:chaperonin GroES
MELKPLHDHVILKPVKEEEITKSGIVLPDTADKDKPAQGEVIAIGPGKFNEDGERMEMSVKVGDKVVFKKYSPDEVKVDGEEYLVVSETDIIAIIN